MASTYRQTDTLSPSERPLAWMVTDESIRQRAFQLWQQDPERSAEDNWRQAEAELRAAAGEVSARRGLGEKA